MLKRERITQDVFFEEFKKLSKENEIKILGVTLSIFGSVWDEFCKLLIHHSIHRTVKIFILDILCPSAEKLRTEKERVSRVVDLMSKFSKNLEEKSKLELYLVQYPIFSSIFLLGNELFYIHHSLGNPSSAFNIWRLNPGDVEYEDYKGEIEFLEKQIHLPSTGKPFAIKMNASSLPGYLESVMSIENQENSVQDPEKLLIKLLKNSPEAYIIGFPPSDPIIKSILQEKKLQVYIPNYKSFSFVLESGIKPTLIDDGYQAFLKDICTISSKTSSKIYLVDNLSSSRCKIYCGSYSFSYDFPINAKGEKIKSAFIMKKMTHELFETKISRLRKKDISTELRLNSFLKFKVKEDLVPLIGETNEKYLNRMIDKLSGPPYEIKSSIGYGRSLTNKWYCSDYGFTISPGLSSFYSDYKILSEHFPDFSIMIIKGGARESGDSLNRGNTSSAFSQVPDGFQTNKITITSGETKILNVTTNKDNATSALFSFFFQYSNLFRGATVGHIFGDSNQSPKVYAMNDGKLYEIGQDVKVTKSDSTRDTLDICHFECATLNTQNRVSLLDDCDLSPIDPNQLLVFSFVTEFISIEILECHKIKITHLNGQVTDHIYRKVIVATCSVDQDYPRHGDCGSVLCIKEDTQVQPLGYLIAESINVKEVDGVLKEEEPGDTRSSIFASFSVFRDWIANVKEIYLVSEVNARK